MFSLLPIFSVTGTLVPPAASRCTTDPAARQLENGTFSPGACIATVAPDQRRLCTWAGAVLPRVVRFKRTQALATYSWTEYGPGSVHTLNQGACMLQSGCGSRELRSILHSCATGCPNKLASLAVACWMRPF